MVCFNYLLSVAVAIASAVPGVLADSFVEAIKIPDIVTYDAAAAAEKRDNVLDSGSSGIAGRISMRTSTGPTVDPYSGWSCSPSYPLTPIPSNPSCNENNCYR